MREGENAIAVVWSEYTDIEALYKTFYVVNLRFTDKTGVAYQAEASWQLLTSARYWEEAQRKNPALKDGLSKIEARESYDFEDLLMRLIK